MKTPLPLNESDLKSVSEFLAPFYNQRPEEKRKEIELYAELHPDADTFETAGFIIFNAPKCNCRKVCVANHFTNGITRYSRANGVYPTYCRLFD